MNVITLKTFITASSLYWRVYVTSTQVSQNDHSVFALGLKAAL
jgi:hypothetical protein